MINLQYDPTLSNCFIGDPARLRQVLINLIGNAIKFTDKGSVTLQVESAKEKDFLNFKIKDTGIGIPENRLEAIFAPFSQADTSTTRKYGGTGLGTTISRQIVECMNGKIWVESEEGAGSTFYFTVFIPQVACPPSYETGADKIQTVFRAKRGLKILLAEDIPENAELASIRLEEIGHQLDVAVNGLETVDKFSKGSYDLILMDVQMPVMDGLEATRNIRRMEVERGGHIPIISLSASVLAKDKVHCVEAGMDGFISKPIDFKELFAEIAKVVSKDSGTMIDELEISPREDKTAFPELVGINTRQGLKNWRDAKRYAQSLISFSQNHRQDGLLIKQALESNDLETAAKISHALKGVAGNLSITHLANIATEINSALKDKRGGYEPLVDELNKSIDEIVVVISQLNNETDIRSNNQKYDFDTNKVTKLFNDMLAALGTDDPNNIEPILEQLKGSLNRSQLKMLVNHVENFSFREAEHSIRNLAEELGLDIGSKHG